MAQLIQLKRRVGSSGAPSALAAGEPAVNINAGVADLFVGDGSNVYDLVTADRQVELAGAQTITGAKTISVGNLHLTGGDDGDVLSTDGAGNLEWIRQAAVTPGTTPPANPEPGDLWYNATTNELRVWNGSTWVISNVSIGTSAPASPSAGKLWYNPTTSVLSVYTGSAWSAVTGNRSTVAGSAPANPIAGDIWWSPTGPQVYNGAAWAPATLPGFAGVATSAPISGNGTSGDPLGVDFASNSDIATGTDDEYPINSAGLRSQLGAAASTLTTTAQTVVPAINELNAAIAAVSGALRLVGTYNVATNQVTPVAGSPAAAGPLPAAASANEGWYVIVTTSGTGTGNAPHVQIDQGDWLVSTGYSWEHIALHQGAVAASGVTLAAVDSQGWSNVQQAIQALHTRTAPGALAVVADEVSIVGNGTTGDPLEVATVDGGTF